VVEKMSAIEDQAKKVLGDVGSVTRQVKEDPSVLLKGPKTKDSSSDQPKDNAGPPKRP
jgi:hypothetical protein